MASPIITQSPRPTRHHRNRDKNQQIPLNSHDQLQERLQDLKSSLFASTTDTDNVYSTEHSADPSPRLLPVLPPTLTREQFLQQNPDYLRDVTSIGERNEDDVLGNNILSNL